MRILAPFVMFQKAQLARWTHLYALYVNRSEKDASWRNQSQEVRRQELCNQTTGEGLDFTSLPLHHT